MRCLFAACCVLLLCGCAGNASKPDFYTETEEAELQRRSWKAVDSLPFFISHYQSNEDTSYVYMINTSFTKFDVIERVWLWVDGFDGQQFSGTISATPEFVTEYKQYQEIKVPKGNVMDWIIYRNDSLVYGDFIDR